MKRLGGSSGYRRQVKGLEVRGTLKLCGRAQSLGAKSAIRMRGERSAGDPGISQTSPESSRGELGVVRAAARLQGISHAFEWHVCRKRHRVGTALNHADPRHIRETLLEHCAETVLAPCCFLLTCHLKACHLPLSRRTRSFAGELRMRALTFASKIEGFQANFAFYVLQLKSQLCKRAGIVF